MFSPAPFALVIFSQEHAIVELPKPAPISTANPATSGCFRPITDDSARTQRYNITMHLSMNRRLAGLEAQRPKRVSGPLVFSCLSPQVQSMWLAVDGDVNVMALAELDVLAAELQRFTE